MSIRLDMEYTAEFNNPTSPTYKDLESSINSVVTTLLTPYPILTCIFSSLCSNVGIINHISPTVREAV